MGISKSEPCAACTVLTVRCLVSRQFSSGHQPFIPVLLPACLLLPAGWPQRLAVERTDMGSALPWSPWERACSQPVELVSLCPLVIQGLGHLQDDCASDVERLLAWGSYQPCFHQNHCCPAGLPVARGPVEEWSTAKAHIAWLLLCLALPPHGGTFHFRK